jgi:hypothetical protein
MLDRSRTAAAIRAKERRARGRAGIRWDLRVRTPTRRLVRAMQAARPEVGPLDTREAVEAELADVVEAFCARWLGPEKNPHA